MSRPLSQWSGSWDPEEGEGEEYTVDTTLMALRMLKGYGLV
jgi:hypothetical protein